MQLLANLKKIALFVAGAASQKFMQGLGEQQEVMGDLADINTQVYALESALLRAQKMGKRAGSNTAIAIVKLYAADAASIVEKLGPRILAAAAEGDMLRTQLAIFRRLIKHTPSNTVALGREVAGRMIAAGQYKL